MDYDEWLSEIEENGSLASFYVGLQKKILDTVYTENEDSATTSDIWEIVIREGLYQNLIENPSVAIGFLLTTAYGPTKEYKQYVDAANNYDDVIVLVALSALVNDITHREEHYLNEKIKPRSTISKNGLGNLAELSYIDKKYKLDEILLDIDREIADTKFVTRVSSDIGLYDHSLIDYLNIGERVVFFFEADYYGYSINKTDNRIDPSHDGCTYHLITNKRMITVVGRQKLRDMVLSIPIPSITQVEIEGGLTKTRIQVSTKSGDNNGPYHIWVKSIDQYYNKSEIIAHLES